MSSDVYRILLSKYLERGALPSSSEQLLLLASEAHRVESSFELAGQLVHNTLGGMCALANVDLIVLADELEGKDFNATLEASLTQPSIIRDVKGGNFSRAYKVDFANLVLVNSERVFLGNDRLPRSTTRVMTGFGSEYGEKHSLNHLKHSLNHLVRVRDTDGYSKYFYSGGERKLSDRDETLELIFRSEWFACSVAKLLREYNFDRFYAGELKRQFCLKIAMHEEIKNKARERVNAPK